jgi:hypothetical protein
MVVSRGTWSRFHLPSVTSVRSGALIVTGVLLVLSGCVAQKNAVSPAAKGVVSPVPTESTQPAQGGTTLVATLAPENPNPSGTGTAQVRLDPQKQEICYTIHVSGIELPATAAHIHAGAAGVNGPIVVPFTPPNAKGVATGCTHTPHSGIVAIMQHPADYYVNVHNTHYPDGAVRGQLSVCGHQTGC